MLHRLNVSPLAPFDIANERGLPVRLASPTVIPLASYRRYLLDSHGPLPF